MKKLLMLIPALLMLGFASTTTLAGEYESDTCFINCEYLHETTEVTNNTTKNYYDVGVSESDYSEGVAASIALSSLQFDFSDSALQVGVGGGWYNGENAAAIGIARRVGDSLLLNATYTETADHGGGGVGATWRF